jgi:hypothetical protein
MTLLPIYHAEDRAFYAAMKAAKAQGLVPKKVIEANGVFAGRYQFVPA